MISISFQSMKNRIILFSLILLLSLVFLSNVMPGIFRKYTAFTYDNGRDMLVTYGLLFENKFILIGPTTGIEGIFHGAWWYYFLALPFLIFRGEPTGIVFTIAIFGYIGLLLFFFFLKKTTNLKIAFLSSLIYGSSPEIIGRFSQIGHNNLEVPLGILAAIALYYFLKKKCQSYWLAAIFGLFSALIFELEFAYGLFVFVFSCLYFLGIVLDEKSLILFKKNKLIVFFGLGVVVVLVPRIIFEVRHQFLMTKNFLNYLFNPATKLYSGNFIDRVINRQETFYAFWKELLPLQINMLSIVLLGLTLLGLGMLIAKKNRFSETYRKMMLYLGGVIGFQFICFVYYKDVIWGNYLNGLMAFYLLTLAFSLFFLEKQASSFKYLYYLFIGLILVSQVVFRNVSDWEGDYSVMRNQKKIMSLIENDYGKKDRDFGWGGYTASGYSYYYDYYYLREEKFFAIPRPKSLWDATINYIIIEPDDRGVLLKKWREKNMDGTAQLIKKWQVVDVKIEKWKL